jgi:hypothetical protein
MNLFNQLTATAVSAIALNVCAMHLARGADGAVPSLAQNTSPSSNVPGGATVASTLPAAALDQVEQMVKARRGYDLEAESLGKVQTEDWRGFPTTLYRYTKKDDDGVKKIGLAVLLDPSPRQVARWIIQAVIDATGEYHADKAKKLVNETSSASGFQFLVRGVHWEDMEGTGVHIAYPFRDGVTVKLRAFGDHYPSSPLNQAQLQYTIDAPESEVTATGKYARIQSTTREEYRLAGGSKVTAGGAWRSVVRELYQSAWGKDRNELMTAKAKSMFNAGARGAP